MRRPILSMLPDTLLVMMAVLLAIPIWSILFLPRPAELAATYGMAAMAAVVAVYWIVPLVVCLLMVLRQPLFIPVFIAECLAFGALIIVAPTGILPLSDKIVRVALVGIVGTVGIALANKDLIFPFTIKGGRFWRLTPRVFINVAMRLKVEGGRAIRLITENCSITGMAVSGSRERLLPLLAGRAPGQPLALTARVRDAKHELTASVVWQIEVGPLLRLGLRADPVAMKRLLTELDGRDRLSVGERFQLLWARSDARRVTLIVWALAVVGSFGAPGCSLSDGDDAHEVPLEGEVLRADA